MFKKFPWRFYRITYVSYKVQKTSKLQESSFLLLKHILFRLYPSKNNYYLIRKLYCFQMRFFLWNVLIGGTLEKFYFFPYLMFTLLETMYSTMTLQTFSFNNLILTPSCVTSARQHYYSEERSTFISDKLNNLRYAVFRYGITFLLLCRDNNKNFFTATRMSSYPGPHSCPVSPCTCSSRVHVHTSGCAVWCILHWLMAFRFPITADAN